MLTSPEEVMRKETEPFQSAAITLPSGETAHASLESAKGGIPSRGAIPFVAVQRKAIWLLARQLPTTTLPSEERARAVLRVLPGRNPIGVMPAASGHESVALRQRSQKTNLSSECSC